ncbi:MAG: c-type cytochrome [Chromatiales bacterium]|nr:c-type cytochrome [Chromatiales bacterium]
MNNQTNTYFGFSVMIVVAVVALNIAISTLMCGVLSTATAADISAEATNARIAPVSMLNTGGAIAAPAPVVAAASTATRSGEEIYSSTCMACHATGAAGAPKVGDSAAWAPRIATGLDALVASATKGKGAMPPKGTCAVCSADELRSTIEYMTSKSQ